MDYIRGTLKFTGTTQITLTIVSWLQRKIQEEAAEQGQQIWAWLKILLCAFFCHTCTFRGGYSSHPQDLPYNLGDSIRLQSS